MNYAMELSIAFSFGLAAGLIYFLALWLTVKGLPRVKNQASFILGSFVLRMGLLVLALVMISEGDPLRFILALAGITVARWLAINLPEKRLPEAAPVPIEKSVAGLKGPGKEA